MSRSVEFIKTTLLGGVVAIVPLTAVAFVLWSILSLTIETVAAMEGVLSFSPLVNTLVVFAVSVAALIVLCFLAGLALRTALGNTIKAWLDGMLERFIPLYGMARTLTRRITGGEGSEFTPAEIDLHGSGARVLGWVVEKLPEGRSAVFIPWTPVPTLGQVYVVPNALIDALDVPLPEIIGPLSEWGAGTSRLYGKRSVPADDGSTADGSTADVEPEGTR